MQPKWSVQNFAHAMTAVQILVANLWTVMDISPCLKRIRLWESIACYSQTKCKPMNMIGREACYSQGKDPFNTLTLLYSKPRDIWSISYSPIWENSFYSLALICQCAVENIVYRCAFIYGHWWMNSSHTRYFKETWIWFDMIPLHPNNKGTCNCSVWKWRA